MLASFQAFFHGYYARVVPVFVLFIMSFCVEHPIFRVWNCVYNRGGPESWIQIALIPLFIYCVWCCCCCSSVSQPHFERACSARQPDLGLKSYFCATYHASSWSNCAFIANVCRIRKYAGKPRSVEIIVSLLGQSLPAYHEKLANGVGLDTPCGGYRPGRSSL